MFDIFQHTIRPKSSLFFRKNDANDVRLGEIVSRNEYEDSDVVILGCPQDEGVRRNNGRLGAALAPDAIRAQFYKLTDFGITAKVFDSGDTIIQKSLEETHDAHTRIAAQILRDGKRIVALGGGNDLSFADGSAMTEIYGAENWLAFNIDAHFDVRADPTRNSGTPYRQLLDEKLINPKNFYEIAFQPQANSKTYFDFLKNLGANLINLEEFQNSNFKIDFEQMLSALNSQFSAFWGFDVDAVRAADAPGTSAPSPVGLSANEFVSLAKLAGKSSQTKIVEFTEVNPHFDVDNRTAKLVAVAIHKFISSIK